MPTGPPGLTHAADQPISLHFSEKRSHLAMRQGRQDLYKLTKRAPLSLVLIDVPEQQRLVGFAVQTPLARVDSLLADERVEPTRKDVLAADTFEGAEIAQSP